MTCYRQLWTQGGYERLTATVFRIVVEIGAGSDTFGARTSARSLAAYVSKSRTRDGGTYEGIWERYKGTPQQEP
jgi:D-serine deaminase-like pyridoxal phosphate-dependent protein